MATAPEGGGIYPPGCRLVSRVRWRIPGRNGLKNGRRRARGHGSGAAESAGGWALHHPPRGVRRAANLRQPPRAYGGCRPAAITNLRRFHGPGMVPVVQARREG